MLRILPLDIGIWNYGNLLANSLLFFSSFYSSAPFFRIHCASLFSVHMFCSFNLLEWFRFSSIYFCIIILIMANKRKNDETFVNFIVFA